MNSELLQQLVDERDIIGRIYAYCDALDSRRFDGLTDVFVPDATAKLGATHCEGRDAIVTKCTTSLMKLDGSHHLVGNHQITVAGDTATSHSYVHAQHINHRVEGEPNFIMAGYYDDSWERTNDGWRIRRRVLTVLWTSGNPAVVGR